jgi:transcriptional regulator with XRE-family HTH domain
MGQQTQRLLSTGGSAWGPERVRLGLSLRELSRRSGIAVPYLSLAENGRMIPSAAEYDAVTRVLREAAAHASGDNAA